MLRSMYSAVSGLRAQQIKMDVIANNIANTSTVGFKKSNIQFADMMTQTMQSSAGPSGNKGGINGIAIGLGTKVSSQDTMFTQGALMTTGSSTDLAIQGDGFFVVSNGAEIFYTRAGNFGVDALGNLVTAEGYKVLGTVGDGNMLTPLQVPLGETLEPTRTSIVIMGNNLNSSTEIGVTHNTSIEVFDSLGNSHIVKVDFTKDADNEWTATMSLDPANSLIKNWLKNNVPNFDTLSDSEKNAKLEEANNAILTNRTSSLVFNTQGMLDEGRSTLGGPLKFSPVGAEEMSIDFDFSKMSQLNSSTTAAAKGQDGHPAGTIKSISFDQNGNLYGMFTGGNAKYLGSLTMATFTNNEGLEALGGTMYKVGSNSGQPVYGYANEGGNGSLAVGYLEASNVDLSEEVTNMITTQRSYQFNSKMITVTDEMLQELVNMKR